MDVFFVGICWVLERGQVFLKKLRLASIGAWLLVMVDDGAYSRDCQHPDDENPPGISRTMLGKSNRKHAEYESFGKAEW